MPRRGRPITRMVTYHNPSDKTITFTLGTMPGSPPQEYTIEPGEEMKGAQAYEKFFIRKGLEPGKAPERTNTPKEVLVDAKKIGKSVKKD